MSEKLSYTVIEAAKALGVSRTQVYRMRRAGILPIVKLMGRSLVRHDDLQAVLNRAPLLGDRPAL